MKEIDIFAGENWTVRRSGRRVTITEGDKSYTAYFLDATAKPAIDPTHPEKLTTALLVSYLDYGNGVTPELGFIRGILAPLLTTIPPQKHTAVLYGLTAHTRVPIQPARRFSLGRMRGAA